MSDAKETDQLKELLNAQLRTLSEKAAANDPQAVFALREFLHEHPEVWQQVGDLSKLAIEQQLTLIASNDVLLRESLLLQLDAFKRKLVEPPGSPIEGILIDRIAVCWLQAHIADVLLIQNSQANQSQSEFLQRRVERAQKNLLAAVKELCTVRKLLREAKARPIRQPRASTKTAAGQPQPAAADSPTNAPASNSRSQTNPGARKLPLLTPENHS